LNLTQEPLVILRDQILLRTPRGTLRREPGGLSDTYTVAPGGAHDVNVRFALDQLMPGESVEVLFDRALLIRGASLPIPPMQFRVEPSV
jgi:hypothetical protein